MALIIALPRERRPSERRVALDPSRVERLVQAGISVRIEADCGHAAGFHDEDYNDAVLCSSFADVVRDADIVTKVVCPTVEEIACLKPGSVLICIMSAFQHLEEVEQLRQAGITVLAMDHMPRTTRAQPMDALSSQATVAGYKAALLAAELSPRLFPMLTTAAGTIRPSRVLVIGAGVAGLQAIATARRLGAQVEAYDIRRAAKEQIESLGARMVDTGIEIEGAGGFARSLRKDEKQKQHDVLAGHLARAHVVICAASIPGRRAPRIITEDMVDGMLPESVIIDLAASTGGNCELTHIGEHYHHNDTLIVGPLNLPSHGAVHASEMYSRNVHNMLQLIIDNDAIVLNSEDDIINRCVVCHSKHINHGPTAGLLDFVHTPFDSAVHSGAVHSGAVHSGAVHSGAVHSGAVHSGAVHSGAVHSGAVHSGVTRVIEDFPDNSAGWLEEPEASPQSDTLDNPQDEKPDNQRVPVNETEASASSESFSKTHTEEGISCQNGSDAADRNRSPYRADAPSDTTSLPDEAEQMLSDEDAPVLDDLTLIDGVGPALQERLYAFGFSSFEAIGSLDEEGIQQLTVRLELDDEVLKQEWPAQARALILERVK